MDLGPSTIVVAIGGRVGCGDVPPLGERLRALLEENASELVVCDVGDIVDPDLATVDALAHLALTARQYGSEICLRNVSRELQELLAFTGLGTCSGSGAFAPDEPLTREESEAPMNSGTPRSRTGENAPEEDPS